MCDRGLWEVVLLNVVLTRAWETIVVPSRLMIIVWAIKIILSHKKALLLGDYGLSLLLCPSCLVWLWLHLYSYDFVRDNTPRPSLLAPELVQMDCMGTTDGLATMGDDSIDGPMIDYYQKSVDYSKYSHDQLWELIICYKKNKK